MTWFLAANLNLHIAAGVVALTAFWIQVFSVKGSKLHIWNGRLFVASGFLVALASLASIGVNIGAAVKRGHDIASDPDSLVQPALLAFISILVLVVIGSGRMLARYGDREVPLPFWGGAARSAIAGLATLLLAGFALVFQPELWIAILGGAAIGAHVTREQVRLVLRRAPDRVFRTQEHVSNMFAAALAFHVAFILIGLDRFIEIWGWGAAPPVVIVGVVIIAGLAADHLVRRRIATNHRFAS